MTSSARRKAAEFERKAQLLRASVKGIEARKRQAAKKKSLNVTNGRSDQAPADDSKRRYR
jgi:hypothetical protein